MTKIYEGPRVLTIQDPFGTLIAEGKKKIETRSWNTKYRGKLLIHVAKKLWIAPDLMEEAGRENVARNLGHIIAEAELVDCIEMTPEFIHKIRTENQFEFRAGFYSVGRFAWILENVKPLDEPIPAKGHLGLWIHKRDWEV